jgi:signal transduction histidine kinase/PAS domain-containing protein
MADPMEPSRELAGGTPSSLASFVNTHEAEILGAWVLAVSERPAARDEPRSRLAARAYPLLAALARAPADLPAIETIGRELARARFAEGLDLAELVAQHTLLREILISRWSTTAAPADAWPGVRAINRAIDAAVSAALAASAELRASALSTIQSLSLAVLENVTLDELLHRLLTAFQEVAPAVEAAALYLSEDDDLLRLHASFGISDEEGRGAAVKVGQGFPGRIAAEKRARFVRVPSAEPLTLAPWKKMRAVQGLPLSVRGRLLGVAVMGSYTSWDFAQADQVAFEVVAKQATGNIYDWKLRESIENQKARLDALLAQMPAGVILAKAPSGKMTLHNAQVEAIWRRPFIHCGSVEEYRAWPAYRTDGRQLASEEFPLARALGGAVVVNQEIEILRGDGSRGTILSNAAPIRARDGRIVGGVTTFVDITEKLTTERKLRQMAAQAQRAEAVQAVVAEASIQLAESFQEGTTLRSIVALAVPRIADGCALLLSCDGQRPQVLEIAHVDARKAALMRALLAKPATEKFGELVDRICRTRKPQMVPPVTEEVLRDLVVDEEDRTMLRELAVASVMLFPLVARGRALGVIAFAATSSRKDFSHQDVVLAQELTRRSAFAIDNERLYREAQHAVQLRDQVLEVVSHDLRGPLSAVRLSAHALANGEASEESVRRGAERILSTTFRMDRLIRSLVDFAAIRSGRLSIERAPADVAQLILEVSRELEDRSERAGVALEHEVEPGLPLLSVDRARIHEALENLITNALKVLGPGKTVIVKAYRKERTIQFSVTDDGPGIAPEEVPRLFDRYFRGGKARGPGLGLGLAITRAIVEGHGGRIWVESALGKGSTFSFTIPLGA